MGIQFHNYDVLVYVRTYAGSSTEFGAKGTLKVRDAWTGRYSFSSWQLQSVLPS